MDAHRRHRSRGMLPCYEHGWGGVQVEDAVEMTARGSRTLTRSSQDLAIIG